MGISLGLYEDSFPRLGQEAIPWCNSGVLFAQSAIG